MSTRPDTIPAASLYPYGELDPDALVELFFPYDGPHDATTVTMALAVARRLVRYANNATQNPRRLTAPNVNEAVGSLYSLCGLLPQLLEQLACSLDSAAAESSTLYDDRYDPVMYPAADLARRAADLLRIGAGAAVGDAGAALREVGSLTTHLGQPPAPTGRGDR